jgi:pimeloyl-ACP methyl ester carboxylesterase
MEATPMCTRILVALLTISLGLTAFSQQHRYPVEDFYHRNITIPINHMNSNEGTFTLYYELSKNFKFDQPTIIFVTDGQQSYGEAGKVDALAGMYQFDSTFNLVFIENRGRQYSFIDTRRTEGTIDWEGVYRLMSSKQMVEDIECIRRDLFRDHPESKLFLFARSGGGYVTQEYLAKYGKHVQRAYLQCAPNPTIMKQLGFLESKSFLNTLNAADPGLHEKLKAVLNKNIVPELHLLWMLFRIQYAVEKPDSIYRTIINDLSNKDTTSYGEYLKRGFDYSEAKGTETTLAKQMGLGMYMSAIQCDGYYLLGSPPDYIDPVYTCLRDLSTPVIQLIEQKKVQPPEPPRLEQFSNIETEVFYQAGFYDHITPYQVGVELGKYFKHYDLFIAEDNHMMMKHKDCYAQLRNAFFKYGIGSKELREIRASMNCREWKSQ